MKIKYLSVVILFILLISVSLAQDVQPQKNSNEDPAHSVYGPPIPAIWEFQLSYLKEDGKDIQAFNFYKKDQRNKTFFFKIANNNLNNRNELRVKEATGAAILFPFNDDDRFQLDIGGTYDVNKDTTLPSKAFFSRLTYRPRPSLWFRYGSEYFDGYTLGSTTPYCKTILNSNYLVGKFTASSFSLVGLIGSGKIDDVLNTRFGFAGIIEVPKNFFLLGGYIKSNDEKENVRTLAIGRWAPFRPDGLPGGIFIWKHKENYDFQLGGIFWGGKNLFVRPAAIGMAQGMFISSMALRENSELRQGKLMNITDDYRNADVSLFYVYMDQGIEMIPGNINHVGFMAVQLFKIFSEVNFSVFSKPVIGAFYNEETTPEFSLTSHKFIDKKISFFSFQVGMTLNDSFIFNVIHSPKTSEWTIALSYLYFTQNED